MQISKTEYNTMQNAENHHWWYKSLHYQVFSQINKYFAFNKSIDILDAGCGTGGLLLQLKSKGYTNILGVDQSKIAIDFCKESGLRVIQANLSEFNIEQSFDVIICNDAFCYMTDLEINKTLITFEKLLKNGGIIISNNNALNVFWGTHDIAIASIRRFSIDDFQVFFEKLKFSKLIYNTYWSFILSPMVLFIRQSQKIQHKLFPKLNYKSDVKIPNKIINKILTILVQKEFCLMKHQPFGSSLFWVIKK